MNKPTDARTLQRIRQLKRGIPVTSLSESEAQFLLEEVQARNDRDDVKFEMLAQLREDGWKVVRRKI